MPAGSAGANPPSATSVQSSTSSKEEPISDRPLISYAYAESVSGRANFKYFLDQALHGAADFIFIINGETDAADLIPQKPNIRVVRRNNTCFDLGAHGEVLRENDLWKKYKRFITLNASIRGPFVPRWSRSCWSDVYLGRVTEKVKVRTGEKYGKRVTSSWRKCAAGACRAANESWICEFYRSAPLSRRKDGTRSQHETRKSIHQLTNPFNSS